jgi:hypothetical protein
MAPIRQSRQRRKRGVRVVLTERDELLLEALGRFRLARTRDLLAVAFVGVHAMTASARLRRLFDAGYLDVHCRDRSEENTYALGSVGHRWAREHALKVTGVPRGGTAHHLSVVRVWSAIAEVVQRRRGARLALARGDWELREEFGHAGLAIIPDLFLVLGVDSERGERAAALAVEVDLGSEPLAVLERKIELYAELARSHHGLFGQRDFGLAIALGRAGRADALRQMIGRLWSGWWVEWAMSEGPAVAIGEVLDVMAGARHGPVTESRYGNGRRRGVSHSVSRSRGA